MKSLSASEKHKPTFWYICILVTLAVGILGLIISSVQCAKTSTSVAQTKVAEKMAMIMIGSNPRFTVTELDTPTNRLMYLIKDSETKLEFIYVSDTGVVVLPQHDQTKTP